MKISEIRELTRKRTMGQTLLVATILNMGLNPIDKTKKAISLCEQYGVNLQTRVNGYSAHYYLGLACDKDLFDFLSTCDSKLKFDVNHYAFGVGSGIRQFTHSAQERAKQHANDLITVYPRTSPIHLQKDAVIDKIAEGAGHSGNEDYAKTLIEAGARKTSVAGGAAHGGNLSYVTKLMELYPQLDVNEIAFSVGFGAHAKETKELAIKLIDECNADVAEVACGAALGGLSDFVEELIKTHNVDANRLIRYVVIGGDVKFAEVLRKSYNADINLMAWNATGEYKIFLINIINNNAKNSTRPTGFQRAPSSAGSSAATPQPFKTRVPRPYSSIFNSQKQDSWLDNKKMTLVELKTIFDESCNHYTAKINLMKLAGDEMEDCLTSLIRQTLELMMEDNKNTDIHMKLQTTIEKTYKQLSLKLHPDKQSENLRELANEAFKSLHEFKVESFGTKELLSVLVKLKPIPQDKSVDDRLKEVLAAIDRGPDASTKKSSPMSPT